jgi:hypothetical protein
VTRRVLARVGGGAAIAVAVCVAAAAAVPRSSPRITLSDPLRDYELRSVGISPDEATIHLIHASYPKGSPSATRPLTWTVVDASGAVVSQGDPLARLPPLTASSVRLGPDTGTLLAVTADGTANLLLQTTAGDLRLLRLRRGSEAAVVLPVDLGSRGVDVRRMLLLPGDRLLLLGAIGEQPLAAVIAADGKVLARHQLRQVAMGLVGAAAEPDGSLVIVGEKGTFPNSTTWVGRVSPSGALSATKEFPGRPADVARGSDGTTLVLIETSESRDVIAKGLDPALAERWTRTLVSGLPVPIPFHVAAVRSGGFVVSGARNRALWVSRLKVDGSEMWSDTVDPGASPEMEMARRVDLVASGDAFAVAYSAFVVAAREQREVIRAFRFTVN